MCPVQKLLLYLLYVVLGVHIFIFHPPTAGWVLGGFFSKVEQQVL